MSQSLNNSEEIEKFLETVVKSEEKTEVSFKMATFLTKKQLAAVNLICNLAIFSAYSNFIWRLVEIGEDSVLMEVVLVCFFVSITLFAVSSYKNRPTLTNTLTSCNLLLFSLFLYFTAIHLRENIDLTVEDAEYEAIMFGFIADPEKARIALETQFRKDLIYGQLYVITNVGNFASIFLFFLFFDSFSKFYSFITFLFCISISAFITFQEYKIRDCATVADITLYSSLLGIVGAVKCYLYWMTRNLTQKNQNLSKIREFYQNWITQNKMSYILLKNKEIAYTNQKQFSRNFLDSLEIYQSLDRNIKEGHNFSESLSKIQGGTVFETKAILRQPNSCSQERFFECLVKSYSPGYSEVILIDNSSVVKTEKKKVEQEYSRVLFAKITHEFKTPLNNIQLLTERLGCQIDCSEVKTMHNLAHFMFYLVKDMADYFQRGRKIEVIEKEMSLTAACQFCFEVVESLVALNSDKKDFLKVKFDNLVGEAKIIGDKVRIQQILLNLLSNSIKFTFSGKILLRLEKDKGGYKITVTDTGKGMSREMLEKVLNLDGSLQIRAEYSEYGTGLGLSIVQDLVAAMDFKFEIKSEIGFGTSVSIAIPWFEEEEESLSQTESCDFPLFLSPQLLKEEDQPKNFIFVVDDNALNRSSITGILTKIKNIHGKNWNFVSLTDGIHLLSSIITHLRQGFTIEAVIIDENMEILDGSKAVGMIRNLEKEGKVPRIKYFSYSSVEDSSQYDQMISKGLNDVVPKPGTAEDVLAVLSRHELV